MLKCIVPVFFLSLSEKIVIVEKHFFVQNKQIPRDIVLEQTENTRKKIICNSSLRRNEQNFFFNSKHAKPPKIQVSLQCQSILKLSV